MRTLICILFFAAVALSQNQPSSPQQIDESQASANLVHKVTPAYPADAKAAGVEGKVVLDAIIGKDGHIKNLTVVSGDERLVPAATDAVAQWVYKPVRVNGKTVEVETHITVNFILAKPDSKPPAA